MRRAFQRTSEDAATRRVGKEEARMKAFRSLRAVMLLGALSVAVGSNVAVAKGRHQVSEDGTRGLASSGGGQKSGGNRSAPGIGAAKNSTATPGNNASGNQNVRGPVNAGPTQKGDSLPGKASPQNVGPPQSGKNPIGDRGDGTHHQPDLNTVRPGSMDAGKGTPVIADGPGHKTNRPADTTKKITTIVRPHVVRESQHPTALGKIERNSVGAVIPHDVNPKLSLDPKVSAGVNGVLAGPPGPTAAKTTIPNAGSISTATVRPGPNLTNPPQHRSIISGSLVGHPSSSVTSVGGPARNLAGALSGNSFKPKHP